MSNPIPSLHHPKLTRIFSLRTRLFPAGGNDAATSCTHVPYITHPRSNTLTICTSHVSHALTHLCFPITHLYALTHVFHYSLYACTYFHYSYNCMAYIYGIMNEMNDILRKLFGFLLLSLALTILLQFLCQPKLIVSRP